MDRAHLWPDLMCVKAGPLSPEDSAITVCICDSLQEAVQMQDKLKEQGALDRCAIFVPTSSDPGAVVVAMNAGMAFCEQICAEGGEAAVIVDLEPMHKLWNMLASAAGEERDADALGLAEPEEQWTEMDGTILTESIAERRKFWFALISRAVNPNSKAGGSVSLLAWLWEQQGSFGHRRVKAIQQKIEDIRKIPRISDVIKDKMVAKVKDEARKDGLTFLEDGSLQEIEEPELDTPGVPNWEIEELKSITDGHILLNKTDTGDWRWIMDPYKSLPRLGMDALHPALCSVDSHKIRLKMMQGHDRATMLHDTLGSKGTLDQKGRLEMRFIDLILEQPAEQLRDIREQVARLVVVANPECKPLKRPDGCNIKTLDDLASQLLASEAGQRAIADIKKTGVVSDETQSLMVKEIDTWE